MNSVVCLSDKASAPLRKRINAGSGQLEASLPWGGTFILKRALLLPLPQRLFDWTEGFTALAFFNGMI